MGEVLTPVRLQLYAADLADLDRCQLETAFRRARRELKFFPKIAELRDLAGAAAKDERNVEAEGAWKWANDYLRKWGVDLMAIYSGGKRIEAPVIPARIAYALRRIGGLSGLNQVTADSRPFVFRDFCEAWNLAPIAETLAPQLADKFPITEGQVKQLTNGAIAEQSPEIKAPVPTVRPKPFSQPLTDDQRRERYEMLTQQAQSLRRVEGQPHSEDTANPTVAQDRRPLQTQAQGCEQRDPCRHNDILL